MSHSNHTGGRLVGSRLVGRFAVAAVAVLGTTAASQARILIDFGDAGSFRGAGVPNPDPNGNFWNSVNSSAFYPDILDTTGAATAVDFGFSSANGSDSFNGPAGVTNGTVGEAANAVYDAAALGDLGVDEAVFDYFVNSTFLIQMLDPTETYDLTFFGSHKFNNNNTTTYTSFTDGTFSVPVSSVDLVVGVDDAHNQDQVAVLSGLMPQVDDILYIGFSGAGGVGNGYHNALQIDVAAVPEPASLGLLGLGVAALSRRRW